jgi:hypothetical protein
MRIPIVNSQFLGFFPPYHALEVLNHPRQFPGSPLPTRGAALIWNTHAGDLRSIARSSLPFSGAFRLNSTSRW